MQFTKMVKLNLRLTVSSLFALAAFASFGQSVTLKSKHTLPFEPTTVSIDRQGYLYIANKEGTIHKLNTQGEIQSTFSPQKRGMPTLLETWQGLRVFVFYQNFQEYLLLNRFLANENRVSTDFQNQAPYTGLATLSNDNNLWLLNDRDLILTKRDINNQEIISETQLNLITNFNRLDIHFMRAYQNFLFMATNNGILIFDNLGNYMSVLSQEDTEFFTFNGEELIFLKEDVVQMISISSKTKREIRLPELPKLVIMENNQVFAFQGKDLIVYVIN